MVGSVIVHNNQIIGEGWHQKAGEPHAEVNAIRSVSNTQMLKEATIYVNLEPCAHHGKTPPCSDLIIEMGITRVVIGCRDPFIEVNGKGVQKLKKAGIEVIEGILEKESLDLNKRFFTYHQKKRPYIILKWAQSQDGFMDAKRNNAEKGIFWITEPKTKILVHKWRSEEDAILVGTQTVENDNPELTVRKTFGRNPKRLIIDQSLTLNRSFKVFDKEPINKTFYSRSISKNDTDLIPIDFNKNTLPQIMDYCYEEGIQSLIIEGGAYTLNEFLANDLWDEARVLIGNSALKDGLKAPRIETKPQGTTKFGEDQLKTFYR